MSSKLAKVNDDARRSIAVPKTTMAEHTGDNDRIHQLFLAHKEQIRKLYQGQDSQAKTLKEIKTILERDYGFPEMTLYTYEIKLRAMNMRKKLSRDDWRPVWQRCRIIQQQGGTPVIRLNGTPIPWLKAWKEIRRNRFHGTDKSTRLLPLPRGVEVFCPTQEQDGSPQRSVTSGPGRWNNSGTMDISLPELHSHSLTVPGKAMDEHGSYHSGRVSRLGTVSTLQEETTIQSLQEFNDPWSGEFCKRDRSSWLNELPWLEFMGCLQAYGKANYAPRTGATSQDWLNSGLSGLIDKYKTLSLVDIDYALFRAHNENLTSNSAIALEFDPVYFLGKALLRLSNSLIDPDLPSAEDRVLYKIIMTRISKALLVMTFSGNVPTARASIPSLIRLTMALEDNESFRIIVKALGSRVIASHCTEPDLMMAAAMHGESNLLREVLCGWSFYADRWCDFPNTVVQSIMLAGIQNHPSCWMMLICSTDVGNLRRWKDEVFLRYLDLSRKLWRVQYLPARLFSHYRWPHSSHMRILQYFLDNGANASLVRVGSRQEWEDDSFTQALPRSWALSALEEAYYRDKQEYALMSKYTGCPNETSTFMRTAVWSSASNSSHALRGYLKSIYDFPTNAHWEFLEMILAEQFRRKMQRHVDWRVINALLDCGVHPALPHLQETPDDFVLCHTVHHLTRGGPSDGAKECMKRLLESSVSFTAVAVSCAVSGTGTDILNTLREHGADIQELGCAALERAASLNNIEALSWLLESGVDPRGLTMRIPNHWLSNRLGRNRAPKPETVEQLLAWGTIGGRHSGSVSPVAYVESYIEKISYGASEAPEVGLAAELRAIRALCDAGADVHLPGASKLLVHSAEKSRWDVFAYLLDRGCPVTPHNPLPAMIKWKAPIELIERVLDAGADPNGQGSDDPFGPIARAAETWNLALIQRLVGCGATLHPAKGRGRPSSTPLFAACRGNTVSESEARAQVKTVKYLLANRDIPACNCDWCDINPSLCAAAWSGNIEMVLLLLESGADCNSDAHIYDARKIERPLDSAACGGRLDSVQILLNAGALSGWQENTPYDGAIDLALKRETRFVRQAGFPVGGSVEVARLVAKFAVSRHHTPRYKLRQIDNWLLEESN